MANPPTALHTGLPASDQAWLETWLDRAPVLEPDEVDEILEMMDLL